MLRADEDWVGLRGAPGVVDEATESKVKEIYLVFRQ